MAITGGVARERRIRANGARGSTAPSVLDASSVFGRRSGRRETLRGRVPSAGPAAPSDGERAVADLATAFERLARVDDVETLVALATCTARELSSATACRLYLSDVSGGQRLAWSDPPHLAREDWKRATRRRVLLRESDGSAAGSMQLSWPAGAVPSAAVLATLRLLASHLTTLLERLYQRERDLAALHALGSDAFGAAGLNGILTDIGRRIIRACGAECGGILLWDPDVERLVVEVCVQRGGSALSEGPEACGSCRLCWPSGDGLVTAAMTERRVVLFGDVRSLRLRSQTDIRSVIAAPMLLEGRPVGLLSLGHSRPHAFNGAHTRLLSSIAADAALAIRSHQNRVAAEELALTAERTRIAQDIHDGVAQDLALLAMRAGMALQDPSQAPAAVADIRKQLLTDIAELRRAVYALRPIDLEKMGLEAALRKLVGEFGEHQRLHAEIAIEARLRDLDPRREAVLYRAVQEGLANAAKHGRARRVDVRVFRATRDTLSVEVVDDGVGFAPEQVGRPSAAGRLGLMQTRERLAALGGALTIHSEPGEGTRLVAQIPTR